MESGIERYEVLDLLGEGACGCVLRARDRALGELVAIKVLHPGGAADAGLRQLLADEVRAVARLDHPSIVRVYDQGVVGPGEATAMLRPGSPWLAMELVEGGSLDDRVGTIPWTRLRWYLLTVLDALAHAHARGTIHRDLKPANVLLDPHGGSIRLTDFGLAHQTGRRSEGRVICGTPGFMAPEQIRGDPHDLGPWTDLYALGATAWTLAAGFNPFQAASIQDTLDRQRTGRLPRLPRGCDAPPGFERWIQGLTERDPARRVDRAARAARELMQLAEAAPSEVRARTRADRELEVDTLIAPALDEDTLLPGTAPELAPTRSAPYAAPSGLSSTTALHLPTLGHTHTQVHPRSLAEAGGNPDESLDAFESSVLPDWRAELPSARPDRRGLGLFGLRSPPLVGREPEQQLLWEELSAAVATRSPRGVVLTGPSGVGVSRLACWLAERVHELGIAEVLQVRGSREGLSGGLLDRLLVGLQARGKPLDEARRRVLARARASRLPTTEARSSRPLLELGMRRRDLVPHGPALASALRLVCGRRAGVVVVEAGPRSGPEIEALVDLVAVSERLPVLLVVVAGDRPAPTGPGLRRVALAPLPTETSRTLARLCLPLDHAATSTAAELARGLPAALVDRLGTWLHGGHLTPTPGGLALRTTAPLEQADALLARLGRALEPAGAGALAAARLAAVLGDPVHDGAWREGCALAGLRAGDLPTALFAADLAVLVSAQPLTWRFRDGALRLALLRQVEGSAAAPLHAACAQALQRHDPGAQRAIGRHWLAAERPARALEPLARGMEVAMEWVDGSAAEALSEHLGEALNAAALPREHRLVVLARLAQSLQAFRVRDLDAAEALLLEAEAGARQLDDPELRGRIQLRQVELMHVSGALEDAEVLARRSLSQLPADGHVDLRARLLGWLGHGLISRGFPRGSRYIEAALELRADEGPSRARCNLKRLLGTVRAGQGRTEEGERLVASAVEEAEAIGALREAWNTRLGWADIAWQRGDLARAFELNRIVAERARAVGDATGGVAVLNLALLELLQGRALASRRMAVEARAVEGATRRPSVRACIHLCVAAGCAASAEWPRFDREVAAVEELLRDAQEIVPDLPAAAEALLELFPSHQPARRRRVEEILRRSRPVLEAAG